MSDLTQTCRITGVPFEIPLAEQDILERLGTLYPAVGEALPLPTVHPLEHLRQNFAWGNIQNLYRGESVLSKKPVLTRYNPRLGYKVVSLEEFWSEDVDNCESGRAYDFSRPFFEQFDELLHEIKNLPLNMSNCEGSEYVNGADRARNCYLCFSVVESEDCMYCCSQHHGTDNVYCVGSNRNQYCYACVDTDSCYGCQNCQDCVNCNESIGCVDCIGCQNCFGCVGLRNAKYHIFNRPYSKEEYKARIEEFSLNSRQARKAALEKCTTFIQSQNHQINRIIGCENCTGTYLRNSKNLHQCTHAADSEDCGYLAISLAGKDCWRGISFRSELMYQSVPVSSYHVINSYAIFDSESILNSHMLYNHCAHCFGCTSLKNKSYCILNKQYTKNEYFDLLPRIILHMKKTGEWGEFFPPSISPHTYAEAWHAGYIADISEDEQRKRGYRMDPLHEEKPATGSIPSSKLPDDINTVDIDTTLEWTVACETSGKPFRFQRKELQFYKRHNIPLPDQHWRHQLNHLLRTREEIPAV